MVPSPYVAENHQEKNARALEKAGACQVLLEKESSGAKLLGMTAALLADDAGRAEMAACAAVSRHWMQGKKSTSTFWRPSAKRDSHGQEEA